MNAAVSARSGALPVSQLSRIGKEFGAIRALSDVDLTINAGDVGGLMGNPKGVKLFDEQ
jgi:simple sugar transport system ATP-binding protein